MIYRFSISTDASTSESSAKETTLLIERGIIHQLDIFFPPGPSGLLHLQIFQSLHQLFPYNTGASFAAAGVNISFPEFIPIEQAPFTLTAKTWNDDDTNAHVVIIRMGILPRQIVAPSTLSISDRVRGFMGVG